jgi:hypothetical protein
MHLGQLTGFSRREHVVEMVRMPLDAILLLWAIQGEQVEAVVERG